MSWGEGPLAGFDTETTGVDVETDRIVTATFVTIEPEQAPVAHEWLIDPGIDIPDGATEVHGITTEHAREYGEQPPGALADIAGHLTAWWSRGLPVVIFNAPFDLTITDRELRRHLGRPIGDVGPVIDPLVIDKGADQYRKGTRKLAPTGDHYRAPLVGGAHDASVDALGACRIAWRLARVFPALAALDLDRLQHEQARKYAEQRTGLERYLCDQMAREGRWDEIDDFHLDRHWPIRPHTQEAAA